MDMNDWKTMVKQGVHNWALYALIKARQMNIGFDMNKWKYQEWSITGGNWPLRDAFMEPHDKTKLLYHINQKMPIFFFE
jgi:hypothetical protein